MCEYFGEEESSPRRPNKTPRKEDGFEKKPPREMTNGSKPRRATQIGGRGLTLKVNRARKKGLLTSGWYRIRRTSVKGKKAEAWMRKKVELQKGG